MSYRGLDENDKELLERIKDSQAVGIVNKNDLDLKIDVNYLENYLINNVLFAEMKSVF